jgi:hypothetical protein
LGNSLGKSAGIPGVTSLLMFIFDPSVSQVSQPFAGLSAKVSAFRGLWGINPCASF